jgi:hypothetical protein
MLTVEHHGQDTETGTGSTRYCRVFWLTIGQFRSFFVLFCFVCADTKLNQRGLATRRHGSPMATSTLCTQTCMHARLPTTLIRRVSHPSTGCTHARDMGIAHATARIMAAVARRRRRDNGGQRTCSGASFCACVEDVLHNTCAAESFVSYCICRVGGGGGGRGKRGGGSGGSAPAI